MALARVSRAVVLVGETAFELHSSRLQASAEALGSLSTIARGLWSLWRRLSQFHAHRGVSLFAVVDGSSGGAVVWYVLEGR